MRAAQPFVAGRAGTAVLAAGGIALALLLAWLSVGVNLRRACLAQDVPFAQWCPAPAASADEVLRTLRARIAANPGDANAYVQLALADRTASRDRSIDAAVSVTPNEPNVLLLRADRALRQQALAEAVPPLVQLVEYRDVPAAAKTLAQLVAAGQSPLLFPYLKPGSHWLPKVLREMPAAQGTSAALPLVARALQAGVLEPDAVRVYMRQLKSSGAWADAYSLWLAQHGKALPALYNGGFDEPFTPDGFDWEIAAAGPASRAGAIVERRGSDERGAVLDVRFTGRAIAVPMVSQQLFIGPGRYRLRGEYMSRQLRMEQGLAWKARCAAGQPPVGTSAPLADTAGSWQPFSFEFSVPAECGLVASLQLETYAPFEAALGARGRVAFDAFSLEKVTP